MKNILDMLRILFIAACGMLNFIYLMVCPALVFAFLFDKNNSLHRDAFNYLRDYLAAPAPAEGIIAASIDPLLMIPLYLLLVITILGTVIIYISFLMDIPPMIARFYMNVLDEYLFIDRKKTILFFITIVLPVTYTLIMFFINPGSIGYDLMHGMILACISNTGVVLLLFGIKIFKEKPDPGEKHYILLRIFGIYLGIILIPAVLIMFAGPYLAYFHLETDKLRIGLFHVVLIYAVYSNYKFYSSNFNELLNEWEPGSGSD